MTDWSELYVSEVAPTMERLAEPVPVAVWVALGALVLVGLALLAFASGSWRLAGVVPIGAAAFVGFMVLSSASRLDKPARYRVGVVDGKEVEHRAVNDSRGIATPQNFYTVQLRTTATEHFDASGTRPVPDASPGTERLSVSETVYAALTEGESAVLVSYPGAEQAVAFLVQPSGAVVR